MKYSIEEHKHRYAAWAASRASSVIGCRFSVEQGKQILEKTNLSSFVNSPDKLPSEIHVDELHKTWREDVMLEAKEMGLDFTHGVAAKLINMYMKTIFVCGGYDNHTKVGFLHPPIDAVLLKSLRKNDIGSCKKSWSNAEKAKWSKFSSHDYEAVIKAVKSTMNDKPLWLIEEYWQGYQ